MESYEVLFQYWATISIFFDHRLSEISLSKLIAKDNFTLGMG
jgi:hypothetical protein